MIGNTVFPGEKRGGEYQSLKHFGRKRCTALAFLAVQPIRALDHVTCMQIRPAHAPCPNTYELPAERLGAAILNIIIPRTGQGITQEQTK